MKPTARPGGDSMGWYSADAGKTGISGLPQFAGCDCPMDL